MSDHQEGPGWWLASDGRWYPPEQAPPVPPPETWAPYTVGGPPPTRKGLSGGAIAAIVIGGIAAVILLLVVAVNVLGTSSDTETSDRPDVPAPTVPTGFEVVDGDGVTIAAPDTWRSIDADEFAMDPEEFAQAFPDAPEGMVEQGRQVFEEGARLLALDFTNRSFASNVNVLVVPSEVAFDDIEAQADAELGAIGAEVYDSGNVDLPEGEALRIRYRVAVTTATGSTIPAEGVQFYLPSGGDTYVITVTALEAVDLADQMAETFRIE